MDFTNMWGPNPDTDSLEKETLLSMDEVFVLYYSSDSSYSSSPLHHEAETEKDYSADITINGAIAKLSRLSETSGSEEGSGTTKPEAPVNRTEEEDWTEDEAFLKPSLLFFAGCNSFEEVAAASDRFHTLNPFDDCNAIPSPSLPSSPSKELIVTQDGESPIFCPIPVRDDNWVFTMDDSPTASATASPTSSYPPSRCVSPASTAVEGEELCFSPMGNPFADTHIPLLLNELLGDMDVDALLFQNDCEWVLDDRENVFAYMEVWLFWADRIARWRDAAVFGAGNGEFGVIEEMEREEAEMAWRLF